MCAYSVFMKRGILKSQYTIRDIPPAVDHRLRETAALEEISLNQAAVRAIQRGLGTGEEPVRYRSVRELLPKDRFIDTPGWAKVLRELDRIDPADWK